MSEGKRFTSQKARIHERVRRQHSRELSQDYVEAIFQIRSRGKRVKVSHLQEIFGVSHVTIIRKLQRLEDDGLLSGTKSKAIELTDQGREMAQEILRRHELLRCLFVKLGVDEEQADADAEGAEHHLSEETLQAIESFLESSEYQVPDHQ